MASVHMSISEGIAEIILDNPPVNTMTAQIRTELLGCFAGMRGDPSVRAAIITGAGERAFCAGADLKEECHGSEAEALAFRAELDEFFGTVEQAAVPVIAAVNGYCLGGGFEIALCCDLRLACDEARFGSAAVKVGRLASTQRLPRLIGATRAKELIYTARQIGAVEAERIGLVNAVVARAELLPSARRLAAEIAANAPLSIRLAKRAMAEGLDLPLAQALQIENRYWLQAVRSDDAREALEAFFAKRPPRFRGA